MSLEGSLQTFALPEVLHLLADTSKSGELRLNGPRATGRLWFESGELSGFESGHCEQAVDALFDLLRMNEGGFVFDADVVPPEDAQRPVSGEDPEAAKHTDIRPLLAEAEARLLEWGEIVAVVPSLAHEAFLVDEAPEGGVALDGSQWSMVVAIGEGRAVQDVLDHLGLPEFDGCKALKQLVDDALAEVVEPGAHDEVDDDGQAEAAQATDVVSADGSEPAGAGEVDAFESDAAHADTGHFDTGHSDTGDPAAVGAGTLDAEAVHANADEPGAAIYAISCDVAPHEDASIEARAALNALLGGMAAAPLDAPESSDSPDGLADRGPRSSDELASLDQSGPWHEEEPQSDEVRSHAEAHEAHDAHHDGATDDADSGDDDQEAEQESDEPINRGLLLKFLSSVRS